MSLNDFKIGRLLGKGAFGIVLLVKRIIDGQIYAMKQVRISQLTDKEKENALNEIRILASLSHKNIIGYKDAFFDENSKTLNIVMEYADGGDMSKKIKYNLKNGLIFRENIIWNYLIQILEGLNYLHEKNIIHRDLKSANIFLTKNGTIKIGDLNVSKIAKVGMAYTQTGTPYYASPEIWLDKPYDYKSDIWSLGCILYELCQLKPPFRGTSLKNLCCNIQSGVYEPIMSFYSEDLRKIIGMMLRINPNMRPNTTQILSSNIIINKKKELKIGLSPQDLLNQYNEEQKGLIATIKMPRNLREINGNLPMNKYKKYSIKQNKEEMLKEDEYETNKRMNGFLNEEDKKEIKRLYGNQNNANNNNINNMKNNYLINNYNNNIRNINNNKKNNNNNNNYFNNLSKEKINSQKQDNNYNNMISEINSNNYNNNKKALNKNNQIGNKLNYFNNDLNRFNLNLKDINNNGGLISLNNDLIQNRNKLEDYNYKNINNKKNKKKDINDNNNYDIFGNNNLKNNKDNHNNIGNNNIDDYISQNINIYNNINKYYYSN